MDDLKVKKAELEKNGWTIFKNVFTRDEIQNLREKAMLSEKQGLSKKDLFSNPNFTNIVLDEKILKIVSSMLGDKQPVYFGDSSYQIASVKGNISSGFHKDNVEREDINGHDWQSPYTIIRVGIYLQDHAKHSEGVILRTGSHKFTDLTKGKKVNAPSEPGDVLIWYLTTTHSGNAKRLKFSNYVLGFDGTRSFTSMLYFRIPKYAPFLIQKGEKDRIAMFLTYGIKDHHLDHYLTYLKTRKYAIKMWRDSPYSSELLNQVHDKKLTVLSMTDEIKDVKLEELTR